MENKFTLFYLLLMMMMFGRTAYAEKSDFIKFYCGQYLDKEKNLEYSFIFDEINRMNAKDLAKISFYVAIMGNSRFGENPGIRIENCHKILPEKYFVKK